MFALILALDDQETFLLHDAWGALALVILLLGFLGIPFSYAFSFLVNNAASGFAFLIILNILAGCIAPTAVFILRDLGTQSMSDTLISAADITQWIFYWFPIFPFTKSLMAIITTQQANNLCTSGIQRETLELICEKYTQIPQLILRSKEFVQCCKEPIVKPEWAI